MKWRAWKRCGCSEAAPARRGVEGASVPLPGHRPYFCCNGAVRVPVSLCGAVFVVLALRVRAYAVPCVRGGLARCCCVAIVKLRAESGVAVLPWLVVIRAIFPCHCYGGVRCRCLQVSPLLPRLQLNMAVCNLNMHVEWQRWTRNRCDGMRFSGPSFEWRWWSVWNAARCCVVRRCFD